MAKVSHILAIPFPLQGHINPLVQLCKRLVSKGIRVTLVTTTLVSTTLQIKEDTTNLINIETVQDVTLDGETDGLDFYEIYIRSFRASITAGISDIIQKHSNSDFPLKAIVYDSVIPWVLDLASEHGLKGAVLFTQSCTVSSIFYHLHKGSLEIPPAGGCNEVSLPGMPVMELRDLPTLVYAVNSYPSLLRLLIEQFSTFERADWRLFNSFDKLEDEMLKWMATKYPILTIGPTVPSMYIDKRLPENYDYGLNLFKPQAESCVQWLDTKDDQSVIYVSFGSLANLSENQMEELAFALIDANCSFLWVVRETEQKKLPQNIEKVGEKGMIVGWCRQLEVLSHRAVVCFLTHGGWNSTLEAMSLGVPMVVMPQWTDQTTNAKMIDEVWGIGARVVGDVVKRERVADCLKDVVGGERGREIRRNAARWKEMAVEAVGEGGSSDRNLDEFAREILK